MKWFGKLLCRLKFHRWTDFNKDKEGRITYTPYVRCERCSKKGFMNYFTFDIEEL